MLKTALTVDQVIADLSRFVGYLPVGWWEGGRAVWEGGRAVPVTSVSFSSRHDHPTWALLTNERVPPLCQSCDLPEGHGGLCIVMRGLWRVS